MDKERQAPLHPMQQDVIDELNKLENSLLAGMNQMSLKGADPVRLGTAREHIEAAFANMRYIAAGRKVDKPAEYPAFQRPKGLRGKKKPDTLHRAP